MNTLSERIRPTEFEYKTQAVLIGLALLDMWADEVEALEDEITRAMDALFRNGWHPDDAKNLGSIVEGVVETLTKDGK